jgi:quercetin dioxygenase-like cupin family protein
MSRTGEKLVDIREATVQVLVDRPELVMTYARLQTEGGPPLHVHRQHADTFAILGGELHVGLAGEEHVLGEGWAWSAPIGLVHGYQHRGTDEMRFLNLHSPGMGFADYLFGERSAEEVDQFEPPEDGGLPASEAVRLRLAEEGETVTDRPERTIRILTDLPELCMTWTRYVAGEEGPGPHIHREHVDAFFVLSGELNFGVGPGVERVKAGPGTFVLAPPEVVHTFRNDGAAEATWLNFHAPSKGFASFLRDPDFVWDSFDAPADGGRPLSEAIVDRVDSA